MRKTRLLAMIVAIVMALGLLPGGASALENSLPDIGENDIVILYTNDIHCGYTQSAGDGGAITNIGYAGVAGIKAAAEKATSYVTLVDAGDALQGDAIGTMSKGEYLVRIMNEIGYDIFVPGNHEFDYGMARMRQLLGVDAAGGAEQLEADVISSNFIDLGANLRSARDDKAVFAPYTIETYGEIKVAYVGITTPETFTSSTPAYFQNARGQYIYGLSQGRNGEELYSAVQAAIDAAVEEGGADYVIAVGHLGIDESSAPWRSIDVIENTTGLSAFIDGHSHSVVESQLVKSEDDKDVVLTQTGTKLANVGILTIDADDGGIAANLISGWKTEDAAVKSVVNAITAEFEGDLAAVVANTAVDLVINDPAAPETRIIRSRETNLGDLAADAYRYVLGNGKTGNQAKPADIGFVNGGGIRTNIATGDITFGEVIAVHPFNNVGCVVEATGQEILDALEMASRYVGSGENGGFLQVSGLSYTVDTSVASTVVLDEHGSFQSVSGARRVKDVLVGGAPIKPRTRYTVASHNYMLLDGGDGINMFRDNKVVVQPVILDNQILITYIEEYLEGVVGEEYADPYGQGRITILPTAEEEAAEEAEEAA